MNVVIHTALGIGAWLACWLILRAIILGPITRWDDKRIEKRKAEYRARFDARDLELLRERQLVIDGDTGRFIARRPRRETT